MLSDMHMQGRRDVLPGAQNALAGLVYAMPMALALWALIVVAAIKIF
jgi:hypothetical protein